MSSGSGATRDQLTFGFDHRAASGVEDFMPAPCNQEARAWLDRWPDWPGHASVLYGPAGSGKSHLARIWSARAQAISLEPEGLAHVDPASEGRYLIDPATPVVDERALLHFYNRVGEERGYLLLCARRPPAGWGLDLPDLASRLRAAPAIGIGPPDDQLLAALLVKLFADRQIEVSADLVTYLVRHMERSFAGAQALVRQLDAAALRQKRSVTIALARTLLQDTPSENG